MKIPWRAVRAIEVTTCRRKDAKKMVIHWGDHTYSKKKGGSWRQRRDNRELRADRDNFVRSAGERASQGARRKRGMEGEEGGKP